MKKNKLSLNKKIICELNKPMQSAIKGGFIAYTDYGIHTAEAGCTMPPPGPANSCDTLADGDCQTYAGGCETQECVKTDPCVTNTYPGDPTCFAC